MNDFVNKLIGLLEPTTLDLDDQLKNLSSKKEILNDINKMLISVNDDVSKVGKYENQELILNNLNNLNTNETEYRACCYLLSSDDKNVRLLPQYVESSNYISRLINYFKRMYEQLALEASELEVVCNEKMINKKYLEIFKENEPIIYDTEEFTDFLEKQELTSEDKVNLLVYVIKNNVLGYLKGRKS